MFKFHNIKVYLFAFLLFILLFSSVGSSLNFIPKNNYSIYLNDNNYDNLDQYNHIFDENYEGIIKNHQSYSQSFIPRYPILTRIKLLLYKTNQTNENLNFYVYEDFYSPPIIQITKSYDVIPNNYENADWIEFDFDDFEVNTSKNYYIVLRSSTEDVNNFIWIKSNQDFYINGNTWYYRDEIGYWIKIENEDMCFETYGMPNLVNSIIFGEIIDLSETGDYIVFNAKEIRRISFSPFNFNSYVSHEKIVIKKPFKGIIAIGFVFAISDSCVYI